jgi:transcriptional regulator with XRE-family HTH domain
MVQPDKIKKLRELAGWSARELARRAQVSVQWITDVEGGVNQNPGWQRLASVERAFREALVQLGEEIGIRAETQSESQEDAGAEPGFVGLSRDDILRRQLGINDKLMQELLLFRMNGTVQTIEDAVPHALAAKAAFERPRSGSQ